MTEHSTNTIPAPTASASSVQIAAGDNSAFAATSSSQINNDAGLSHTCTDIKDFASFTPTRSPSPLPTLIPAQDQIRLPEVTTKTMNLPINDHSSIHNNSGFPKVTSSQIAGMANLGVQSVFNHQLCQAANRGVNEYVFPALTKAGSTAVSAGSSIWSLGKETCSTGVDWGNQACSSGVDLGSKVYSSGMDLGGEAYSSGVDWGSKVCSTGVGWGSQVYSRGADLGSRAYSIGADFGSGVCFTSADLGKRGLNAGASLYNTGVDTASGFFKSAGDAADMAADGLDASKIAVDTSSGWLNSIINSVSDHPILALGTLGVLAAVGTYAVAGTGNGGDVKKDWKSLNE